MFQNVSYYLQQPVQPNTESSLTCSKHKSFPVGSGSCKQGSDILLFAPIATQKGSLHPLFADKFRQVVSMPDSPASHRKTGHPPQAPPRRNKRRARQNPDGLAAWMKTGQECPPLLLSASRPRDSGRLLLLLIPAFRQLWEYRRSRRTHPRRPIFGPVYFCGKNMFFIGGKVDTPPFSFRHNCH